MNFGFSDSLIFYLFTQMVNNTFQIKLPCFGDSFKAVKQIIARHTGKPSGGRLGGQASGIGRQLREKNCNQ
jgi:hypothetical protein